MMAQSLDAYDSLQSEIYRDGFTDGYNDSEPKFLEVNYLQGFAAGCRAKSTELSSQLALLTQQPDRYQQIYSSVDEF